MTRPSNQAQRARRLLNQATMQRSHRRCDLIRFAPEDELTTPLPRATDEAEQTDQPSTSPPLS